MLHIDKIENKSLTRKIEIHNYSLANRCRYRSLSYSKVE
jgi:hypothetical protein